MPQQEANHNPRKASPRGEQIAAEARKQLRDLWARSNEQLRDYDEPSDKLVDAIIQSAIKKATEEKADLLDWAWTILANAGGGDWTKESKDWQVAVVKWRDEYHKDLSARRKTDPQCNLPRAAHTSELSDQEAADAIGAGHDIVLTRKPAHASEQLLPCPFCGSAAVMHDKGQFWVSCNYIGVCPVSLYDSRIHGCTYKKDAIRIWNSRAAHTSEPWTVDDEGDIVAIRTKELTRMFVFPKGTHRRLPEAICALHNAHISAHGRAARASEVTERYCTCNIVSCACPVHGPFSTTYMDENKPTIAGERTQPQSRDGKTHSESEDHEQPQTEPQFPGSERGGLLYNGKTAKEWFGLYESCVRILGASWKREEGLLGEIKKHEELNADRLRKLHPLGVGEQKQP